MNDAPPRRIWLCADDYGLAEGVNRAIRDLISRGRLNATSVMVVGAAIGRAEVAALQDIAAGSPRCAIGLHATLTAPFRPLTMHFRPTDGGMFLPFPKLLRAGLLRRLDPEMIEYDCWPSLPPSRICSAARPISSTATSTRNYSRGCATPFCARCRKPPPPPGSARVDAANRWPGRSARRRRWCSTFSARVPQARHSGRHPVQFGLRRRL